MVKFTVAYPNLGDHSLYINFHFQFNWTMYFEEILNINRAKVSISPDLKLMIILPNNIKKIVDWITDKPKR
jgi:hypothetical protein